MRYRIILAIASLASTLLASGCVENASQPTPVGEGGGCATGLTAPDIQASSYDRSCVVDGDCVSVQQGGSVCGDLCLFHNPCAPGALNADAAARYEADYTAALEVYATGAGYGCVQGCQELPGPCCVAGQCAKGTVCLVAADATIGDAAGD